MMKTYLTILIFSLGLIIPGFGIDDKDVIWTSGDDTLTLYELKMFMRGDSLTLDNKHINEKVYKAKNELISVYAYLVANPSEHPLYTANAMSFLYSEVENVELYKKDLLALFDHPDVINRTSDFENAMLDMMKKIGDENSAKLIYPFLLSDKSRRRAKTVRTLVDIGGTEVLAYLESIRPQLGKLQKKNTEALKDVSWQKFRELGFTEEQFQKLMISDENTLEKSLLEIDKGIDQLRRKVARQKEAANSNMIVVNLSGVEADRLQTPRSSSQAEESKPLKQPSSEIVETDDESSLPWLWIGVAAILLGGGLLLKFKK